MQTPRKAGLQQRGETGPSLAPGEPGLSAPQPGGAEARNSGGPPSQALGAAARSLAEGKCLKLILEPRDRKLAVRPLYLPC